MEEESNQSSSNEQDEVPTVTNEAAAEVALEPKKKSKLKVSKKHLLLFSGAAVLVVTSSLATYTLTKKETKSTESQSSQTVEQTTENDGKDKVIAEEKPVDTKNISDSFTWQDPSPVGEIPIYDNLKAYYQESFPGEDGATYAQQHKYYLVGKSSSGAKAYITTSPPFAMGAETALFVVEKDGKYTIYQQHSEGAFYANVDGEAAKYQGPKLSNDATVNESDIISEIESKKEIKYRGQTLAHSGNFFGALEFVPSATPQEYDGSTKTFKKVTDLPEGTLYEHTVSEDPSYKISNFRLLLKNHMSDTFVVQGELSKQDIDPITWTDGSKNADNYASVGRGCGNSGANEIALNVTKDQLAQIGKSDKGQAVYGFKNASALLATKHFNEYKDSDTPDSYMYRTEDQGLSMEEFIARRPIYLVEDSLSRWLVFSNMRYVPVGGCAKPVVYLYPEWPQSVDVTVGADVTVSDPLYTNNGWQDVFATPAGQLLYKGKVYESLFWEGYAHGVYPEIDKGVIVPRSEVVTTWQDQLRRMNLNDKEIQDFVTFWESHIPQNPYTRISWLTTADLQRLAPLYVSGDVQTMIRVFLDMEGLDESQNIAPQQLVGIKRTGFTVVEWGGLVRDGSIPKLQ